METSQNAGVSPRELMLARSIEMLKRQRNAAQDEAAEANARVSIQEQAIGALNEANGRLKNRVDELEAQFASKQESA
jgi:hypothetical protein